LPQGSGFGQMVLVLPGFACIETAVQQEATGELVAEVCHAPDCGDRHIHLDETGPADRAEHFSLGLVFFVSDVEGLAAPATEEPVDVVLAGAPRLEEAEPDHALAVRLV